MSCSRAQTTHKHHIANRTAKKLLAQLFGFGRTHAPEKPQGLTGKIPLSDRFVGRQALPTTSGFAR